MTIDTSELRKVIADCYWPPSPVTINELLARLEATEEDRSNFLVEIGKLCAQCDALRLRIEAAEKERDELRAKIEQMERQEPVACVWRCDNGHIHGSCEQTLPMGAKLYALPGAKGE